MVAVPNKASIAIIALSLTQAAQACLTVGGTYTSGFKFRMDISATDNDQKICDFNTDKDSGSADCADGYSMDYDLDNLGDPVWIKYYTPHGEYSFYTDAAECSIYNCCGGKNNLSIF